MTENTLKEYIGNIYRLEASLYNQKDLFTKIQDEVNRLSHYKGQALSATRPMKGYFKIKGLLAGAVFGGAFGTLISVFALHAATPAPFLTGTAIGASVGILLVMVSALDDIRKAKADNKKINSLNQQILISNKKSQSMNAGKIHTLNQELAVIRALYSKTKNILDKYYQKNIIFPKYRNLLAVSSIYEYLSAGRCTCLEGHEGAYNIFENEVLQNIIISKLDEVILRLERIENNQYMLYSAIQDSNKKTEKLSQEIFRAAETLQGIENNTRITAYNSGITAQNTEFLKWIEFFRG